MTKEQLEQMAQTAIVRNPTDPQVVAAAEELHEAINARQAPGFQQAAVIGVLPGNCWTWQEAGSGAVAQASFLTFCQDWHARIQRAKASLVTALLRAEDEAYAEVVESAQEQGENLIETFEATTEIGNPWDLTPTWMKAAVYLGAGILVWKVVK